MSEHMTESLTARVATALSSTPGVRAVVLGGSRARGLHHAQSDYDIGLYYSGATPIDLKALETLARGLDDEHRADLVTPFGGWGPWVNGGGWLTVDGRAVDLLYRDLDRVDRVIAEALQGRFEIGYQVGHPHGYPAIIYAGEIATCRPLWDPEGLVPARQAQLAPYPEALRQSALRRFLGEAAFCVLIARKAVSRADLAYVTGCLYRAVACLTHALFALNRVWLLNEKGSVALADRFAVRPQDYRVRVEAMLAGLQADAGALTQAIDALEALVAEAQTLAVT